MFWDAPIDLKRFFRIYLNLASTSTESMVSFFNAVLQSTVEISKLYFTSTISHFCFYKCSRLSDPFDAVTMNFTFLGKYSGIQKAMLAYFPASLSTNLSTPSIIITTLSK
eukprot:GHVR01152014.1.p1 GENE.GHVR01152014.1~~GHVR01152014.1.p1  ORF type:complete len:110 (-),score=4.39 GHVR01152014.1:2687-3016(-)